ncbi:hypothetical protein [Oscillatoria acuminata]|uniref:Uncharacterized protein n=1 Tax=Oscillatoria acuminata PCC 6304 TaxID=56110 RepID=K9TJL4_9CYAN|nr:hypothetical protein [Oscillatoria acuminata]AFY82593.1 hypothetical protein Oscil6304_2997 [Oscillatoria acuminata PCC 6304]
MINQLGQITPTEREISDYAWSLTLSVSTLHSGLKLLELPEQSTRDILKIQGGDFPAAQTL